MSWGFFADLRVSMPTGEWRRIRERALTDISVPPGWLGLEDAQLEGSFLRPYSGDETLGHALEWKCYRAAEAIHEIDEANGATKLRVCLMLDKSQLELAFPRPPRVAAGIGTTKEGPGHVRVEERDRRTRGARVGQCALPLDCRLSTVDPACVSRNDLVIENRAR